LDVYGNSADWSRNDRAFLPHGFGRGQPESFSQGPLQNHVRYELKCIFPSPRC
jgi:hypothetical protein